MTDADRVISVAIYTEICSNSIRLILIVLQKMSSL